MITPPGLPPGCPPWFARPAARAWTCAPAPTAGIRAFHALLPGYAPTPLREVPAIAAELGVGRVFVKDESARMGGPGRVQGARCVLGGSPGAVQAGRGRTGHADGRH